MSVPQSGAIVKRTEAESTVKAEGFSIKMVVRTEGFSCWTVPSPTPVNSFRMLSREALGFMGVDVVQDDAFAGALNEHVTPHRAPRAALS